MQAGVALTNAADSSIAHTPWKKKNKIKAKVGTGEDSQKQEASNHSNFVYLAHLSEIKTWQAGTLIND